MKTWREVETPAEGELTSEIHIDTSAIPDFRRDRLAKGALEIVKLAFSQPGAEERYQAWLAKRRGQEKRPTAKSKL